MKVSGGRHVFGDKGYNGKRLEEEAESCGQRLFAERKKNQEPFPESLKAILRHFRRRLEGGFSVLAERFGIEWPGGHSPASLIGRVAGKLAAHTICFILAALLG